MAVEMDGDVVQKKKEKKDAKSALETSFVLRFFFFCKRQSHQPSPKALHYVHLKLPFKQICTALVYFLFSNSRGAARRTPR